MQCRETCSVFKQIAESEIWPSISEKDLANLQTGS